MFKIKTQSKFAKLLIINLLTIFVAAKTILLVHSFSHNQNNFSHQESPQHNCEICALANFQNQILTAPNFVLTILAFFITFLARKFNRAKFSFLLSSYYSQAPPVIS
ncbi:MAG: hypothetical protein SFV53_03120 [Rickettsiales bacterium]|nr:hypothetical protein [Rickettsiales bacterium]